MRYIFLLFLFFSSRCFGQCTTFYQAQFNGGVTGCGYGPPDGEGGTGFYTLNIAPGSSIYQAWLFAGREGDAAPLTLTFNGTSLTFDNTNQVSETFNSPDYGGPSGVHAIDVTALIDSSVNSYVIVVPDQIGDVSDCFTDYYLYVAYANDTLPQVTSCIYLNSANMQQLVVDTFNMNYPFQNTQNVGLAVFMGYACSSSDDEGVYVNGTFLGNIWGPNSNSGMCAGPYGDFDYQSGTLTGLLDCSANLDMNASDALSNIQTLTPNCGTRVLANFTHDDDDNALWAFFFTYTSGVVPANLDTVVCSGTPVQLNTNSSGTITWSPSSGLSCTGCANPVATLANTTTYVADFTSGCGGSVSDTFAITVRDTGALTLQAIPASVCLGDTIMLSAGGDSSVTWSPTTGLSCIICASPLVVPTVTQVYYASAYCVGTDSITVTVNPPPVVQISSDTSTICSTDSAHICATGGFAVYAWNGGQSTACFYTNLAGNYYVTVTDSNGCSAQSNTISLNVLPSPPSNISINGDTLSAFFDSSYQWYMNGQLITGATSPVYIAKSPGNYSVLVTDSEGCSALSNELVISGLNEISGYNISVYPNPSNGAWELITDNSLQGSDITVFDAAGQIVFKSIIRIQKIQLSLTLPEKYIYLGLTRQY